MAKIGLNNFKFGILTEGDGGSVTYGAMQSLGKAVDANVSITNISCGKFNIIYVSTERRIQDEKG